MTTRRILALLAVTTTACLFDDANTEGLPCNADAECGSGLACVEHVCGGPDLVLDASSSGAEDESGSESDESSSGAPEPVVPSGCTPDESECVSDDVLRYCGDDEKLRTLGCQGVCGAYSPSLGCHYFASEDRELCACGPDAEACEGTGTWSCDGSGTISTCDGTKKQYVDCDDVCVDNGWGGADGCGPGDAGSDVCFCYDVCTYGAQRCQGNATLAACDGASWQSFDCDQVCVDNGWTSSLGCMVFPDSGDSSCYCV